MAKNTKPSRHEIRAEQLCRQVQLGINDFLLCDCCDPLLEDLSLLDVIPQLGSSVLLAVFESPEQEMEALIEIETRLTNARGAIRASVAGVVHRKRVPQLQFRVVSRS